MINFIQQFFLNPYLIFLILLVEFAVVTVWALRYRKEYVGYMLGWLVGIFGLVVYGALVGETTPVPETVQATAVEPGMNILQVTLPSLIGIVLGAWSMSLVVQSRKRGVLRSIVVAIITTVSFWLLVFLAIAAPYIATQRMIGLFTWAFGIGALSMIAILLHGGTQIPASRTTPPNVADPAIRNINTAPRKPVQQAKIDDSDRGPRRFGDRSGR